jgi:ABC-type branched-subunit amino acid transport system permease subunit
MRQDTVRSMGLVLLTTVVFAGAGGTLGAILDASHPSHVPVPSWMLLGVPTGGLLGLVLSMATVRARRRSLVRLLLAAAVADLLLGLILLIGLSSGHWFW